MRNLTDHIVSVDQAHQLEIEVLDEPGQGGACHEYAVSYGSPASDEIGWTIGINFQNGPIKEYGVNGITQEVLLAIVIDRLRGFQSAQFACRENAIALTKIEEALMWLQRRTVSRIKRGVEGTNQK